MRLLHLLCIAKISYFLLSGTELHAQVAMLDLSLEELLKVDVRIVTSEHRLENLQKIPISISSFSEKDLELRSVERIEDLQFLVPGLNHGQSSLGGAQVTLRGIGSENAAVGGDPGVAVYYDGIYHQFTHITNQKFFDIERVEVLRGPQGTLYGRNAIGGAINIINKRPTEEFDYRTKLTTGSYDQQQLEAMVNGTLMDGRILGRLSMLGEKRESFYENVSPLKKGESPDNADYLSSRGQIKLIFNQDVSVNIQGSVLRDKSIARAGLLKTDYPLEDIFQGFDLRTDPPTPIFTNYWRVNNAGKNPTIENSRQYSSNFEYETTIDKDSAAITADIDLGFADLSSLSGYTQYRVHSLEDFDVSDVVSWQFDKLEYSSASYSQELRLTSKPESPFEWISGLYYFVENADIEVAASNYTDVDATGGPVVFNVGPGKVETFSKAVFAQARIPIENKMNLTLGLRNTEDQKIGDEGIYAPNFGVVNPLTGGSITNQHDVKWNQWTGKVGLDYSYNDGTFLFLSASNAYKAGGINIGGIHDPYDPESLVTYEFGLKTLQFEKTLQINVSSHISTYKDVQVFQSGVAGTQMETADAAQIKGLELELESKPIHGLQINLNASFINAEFTDYSSIDPLFAEEGLKDLSGNKLIRSPERKISLGTQYTWLRAAQKLTGRIDFAWMDEQYFRSYNLDQDKEEEFHVTNALLSWHDRKNFTADFWVKNIEDSDAVTNIALNGEVSGSLARSFMTPPRTFGMTIKYKL